MSRLSAGWSASGACLTALSSMRDGMGCLIKPIDLTFFFWEHFEHFEPDIGFVIAVLISMMYTLSK